MPRRSSLRLTKRTVDALLVGATDTVYWDRDLPGFGVRVYRTGRKVFVAQARGPRGPKRISLGRYGAITPEAARKRAAAMISRIRLGQGLEPKAVPTVQRLADRYLKVYAAVHCKAQTQTFYRRILEDHVLPELGAMEVVTVGREHVARLHERLGKKPETANRAVLILSKMFSLAEDWQWIDAGTNPCRSVRPYRMQKRERFLTREEFQRLGRTLHQAEADSSVWPPALAAIRLLALTGCRYSEIMELRWDDVDRTVGVLRLRDAKTGPRMVALTVPVAAVLDGIAKVPGIDRVIVGREGLDKCAYISGYWRELRKRAKLEDVRLHDLRHSYASRALDLGESLSMIRKLLGHKRINTTARYAHLLRDADKAAAARVGASLDAHLAVDEPAIS